MLSPNNIVINSRYNDLALTYNAQKFINYIICINVYVIHVLINYVYNYSFVYCVFVGHTLGSCKCHIEPCFLLIFTALKPRLHHRRTQ